MTEQVKILEKLIVNSWDEFRDKQFSYTDLEFNIEAHDYDDNGEGMESEFVSSDLFGCTISSNDVEEPIYYVSLRDCKADNLILDKIYIEDMDIAITKLDTLVLEYARIQSLYFSGDSSSNTRALEKDIKMFTVNKLFINESSCLRRLKLNSHSINELIIDTENENEILTIILLDNKQGLPSKIEKIVIKKKIFLTIIDDTEQANNIIFEYEGEGSNSSVKILGGDD